MPTITIIDDDDEVRAATENLVRSYGFDACTFTSAEEFLDLPEASETACLITDLQMSGMGGMELHEALQRNGRNVPTIFITAFPEERLRRQAQAAGAIGFLSKPFEAATLISCIDRALGQPVDHRSQAPLVERPPTRCD